MKPRNLALDVNPIVYSPEIRAAMAKLGVMDLLCRPSGDVRPLLGTSVKIQHSNTSQEYLSTVQYLSPNNEAGLAFSLCPHAGSCGDPKSGCINKSGHMRYSQNEAVRIVKTGLWFYHNDLYMTVLRHDIAKHEQRAKRQGKVPCVRLNGTSDLRWERSGIFEEFPDVQFYDYTKFPLRFRHVPENYHLTFSISEHPETWERAAQYMNAGYSAAVVVRTKEMARTAIEAGQWLGFPTVNGDEHDLRILDPSGHLVILYAKGNGRSDTSGFVYDVHTADLVGAAA